MYISVYKSIDFGQFFNLKVRGLHSAQLHGGTFAQQISATNVSCDILLQTLRVVWVTTDQQHQVTYSKKSNIIRTLV